MQKYFAVALVAATLVASGCSSDSDDGPSTPAASGTGDPVTTPADTDDTDAPGNGGSQPGDGEAVVGGEGDTTTNGPEDDAGPVELAVAGEAAYSNFYTLFDSSFGGETFDERQMPGEAWTILVPTNAAFASAGAADTPDDLKLLLLRRHVISSGKLSKEELAGLSEIIVNTGDSYAIDGDAATLSIGGAPVLEVIAENDLTIVYGLGGVLPRVSGN